VLRKHSSTPAFTTWLTNAVKFRLGISLWEFVCGISYDRFESVTNPSSTAVRAHPESSELLGKPRTAFFNDPAALVGCPVRILLDIASLPSPAASSSSPTDLLVFSVSLLRTGGFREAAAH